MSYKVIDEWLIFNKYRVLKLDHDINCKACAKTDYGAYYQKVQGTYRAYCRKRSFSNKFTYYYGVRHIVELLKQITHH